MIERRRKNSSLLKFKTQKKRICSNYNLISLFPKDLEFEKNDFEKKNFEIKFMTLCYYISIDYGICKTKSAIQ